MEVPEFKPKLHNKPDPTEITSDKDILFVISRNLRDASNAAKDIWKMQRFLVIDVMVTHLKNAAEAARAMGYARRDERWLKVAHSIQGCVDCVVNIPFAGRPPPPSWTRVSGLIDRINHEVIQLSNSKQEKPPEILGFC